MLCYLDTSALAKWYLNEPGSEEFSFWIGSQQDTHISSLTALELGCLLARRKRAGDFSAALEQELLDAFRNDVQQGHLVQHAVTDENILNATRLLEHVSPVALRTLDAMHLQIALTIGATGLATADKTMAAAADILEFEVVNFAS
jgi:hypothetical protein